jgi:chromosome segregation ATPase
VNVQLTKDYEDADAKLRIYMSRATAAEEEVITVKQLNLTQDQKLGGVTEQVDSMHRDLQIKSNLLSDNEKRYSKLMDDHDITLYQMQDQTKAMTEMKLKTDVLTTTNAGLMSDKSHLTSELRETRTLYRTYEEKCTEMMNELQTTNAEYQELKRRMIGSDESTKMREGRIKSLQKELVGLKGQLDELTEAHETLVVHHDKL